MGSKEYGNGIDMDRYPSVVLINALDTPSNAFETETFLQVGPLIRGLSMHPPASARCSRRMHLA